MEVQSDLSGKRHSGHRCLSLPGRSRLALSNYPLWIAQYSPAAPPQIGGWNSYTFWQFSPSTVVAGIGKPADGDSFNGTSTDLHTLAGL